MFALKTITIDVPDPECPTPPTPVPDTLYGIPVWGALIIGVIILAIVIGTSIVRHHAWRQKTTQREIEMRERTEAAKHRKHCSTCGTSYPAA